MRRRVLIILLTILCLSGTSLCLEVNQQYIIETGKKDAIAAYKDGQFTIVDNWQINGWLRVIAPPRYEYFDNLSDEFQALYLYSYYLRLNKMYFQSLVGKEVDELFFNEEILRTVDMLPESVEDINSFAILVLDRDPLLYELNQPMTPSQEAQMQSTLEKYQLGLMSNEWRETCIQEIVMQIINRRSNEVFAITLILTISMLLSSIVILAVLM